ncbi:unnamed protein product [Symbiodinium pilosum]|uniref:Uncharacterized protein n=1 Tax=Symbiodinium pilosum TaxID=2952 RepID=A0A812L7H8_SYMPI|nr:unnamed protein product [Symbiodinium pilosum]
MCANEKALDWAKAFKKSWYGLGLLIFGRDIAQDWRNLWNRQPVPSLPMTVRSEKDPKKEIPLVFYPDYNATIDDPDMRVKGNLNADVAKLLVDKFKDAEVALIFNDRGGHMVGKLTEWEASAGAFIIRAPHDTYRQIKEAYRSQASEPIILLVFGDKSKPDRRQVLLHADDSVEVTQCAWKWLCSIGLPIVIAVGGAVWWFFDSSWQLGYASIFFLMMPDLIQAFMRNQTHLQSAIKVHSNMTGLLDEEWAILQQGWNCTVQSRTLGSHVAVWDSALFFCGCVLYRLHNIRNKTTHRRCLHYISQHSFPDKLEADVSLGWWFETRATIFADVSRSVAKRNIIFGLFMVAECAMIILTCLASLFDTGNDFAVMCYATAYGVGLGLLTLLFMYLASNVNTELQNGLKEVNSSETKDIEQGSPVTMLKRRRDKQAQEAISELLDYERIHPAKLKFMGVPFTIEFLWGYAAPLGTYATGVIYWIVQNTLIHA